MKNFFKLYKIPLLIIIFSLTLGLAPVVSVVLSAIIANLNGCQLNEGSVNPCYIVFIDFGGLLTAMGVFGWLMLVSIPYGMAGVVFGLIWFIIQTFLLIRQKLFNK